MPIVIGRNTGGMYELVTLVAVMVSSKIQGGAWRRSAGRFLADAIGYVFGRWPPLSRFLDDVPLGPAPV